MTDYLHTSSLNWQDPAHVLVFDEVPLWSALFGQMLLDHVPLRRGMRVLDLGCGAGFPLLTLAGRLGPTCTVYGLDGWALGLGMARRKIEVWGVGNARLIEGDGAVLPFDSGAFDLLVSNLGINNFPDPAAALLECGRVLRPGGQCLLTTNLRGHMSVFYDIYARVLLDYGRFDLVDALDAHVNHRTTVEQTSGWLAVAGFHVSAVHAQTCTLRYADGSAFLRDSFIRMAFMEAWREFLPAEDETAIFTRIEDALNRLAALEGELALTVPVACFRAEKAPGTPGMETVC